MEKLELIATRLKGDSWRLVDNVKGEPDAPSLTQALEIWFNKTKIRCSFRLDPLDSKLYAILEDNKPQPTQKYNIYGELE